jgi:DNA uptake protein ComE-like DNA-binding protein
MGNDGIMALASLLGAGLITSCGLAVIKTQWAVFRGDEQMKNAFAPYRGLRIVTICAVAVLTIALGGCNQSTPNDQEIRQKSADATRDLQKGAKQLAADTKVAAAKAVDGVNAVAQGVKDGVNSNKEGDTGDLVDINSASTARIAMLPGISISKAHDIVEGRPYRNPHALVGRGLLTQEQYDNISDKITAR